MPDIKGYRQLSPEDIAIINEIKDYEIEMGMFWQRLTTRNTPNLRWAAIAKTHFEEGFSALVRSIAKPEERF
jgi:hypothetical protein